LDGIKNKREPIAPTSKNVEHLTEEEKKELGIEILPMSLEEALEKLEKSKFVREVLGNEIVDVFLREKRKELEELKSINASNEEEELNWEYEKYLERV